MFDDIWYIDITDLCKNDIPPEMDWEKYIRHNSFHSLNLPFLLLTTTPILTRYSDYLDLTMKSNIEGETIHCVIKLLIITIRAIKEQSPNISEENSLHILAKIEKQIDLWDVRFNCFVHVAQ